jgi:hypothetical protein
VEAVRLGTQRREAGASRVSAKKQTRALGKERGNALEQALKDTTDRVTKARKQDLGIAQKFWAICRALNEPTVIET